MKTPPAAIALLLISEAALCGSWSYIGGAYPHAAFIESTTILDEGQNTKGFWLAMVNVDKSLPFDTVVNYVQVDCRQRQLRALQSDFYLRGKRMGGDVIPPLWQHIIPDSMGESYLLFVCQKYDPMNYAIPDTPAMELWKIAQPLIKNNK